MPILMLYLCVKFYGCAVACTFIGYATAKMFTRSDQPSLEREREGGETDRQTETDTDRQTVRQTDTETGREREREREMQIQR